MALPKWITPAGQLGIVPELEYYQFSLDAYDPSGGYLVYSKVSGSLPLGIQVVSPTEFTLTTSGNITAYTGSYISQYATGANAVVVLDDTVSGTNVTFRYVGNVAFSNIGNLTVNGSNVSVSPTAVTPPPQARLQGIPVSELGGDQNVTYTFTIRAKNAWTNLLADRTFNLTITNVAPPIITPKEYVNKNQIQLQGNITANIGDYITQSLTSANAVLLTSAINSDLITVRYVTGSSAFSVGVGNLSVKYGSTTTSTDVYPTEITVISSSTPQELGIFLDGSEVNFQLEAIEFTPGADLTWSVKSGDLPPGLTLSADGLLSGYLDPIPSTAAGTTPRWDNSAWSYQGWDFPLNAISKNFTFTIQVFDGVNYDLNTYSLYVYPRSNLTADNNEIPVDTTLLGTGVPLTVDYGNKHNPIITTVQDDLVPVRESSYFSFELEAYDLDGDTIRYSIPALILGSFDEQIFSNIAQSYPYVTEKINSGYLYAGIFPNTQEVGNIAANISASSTDYTSGEFLPGDLIKLLDNTNQWREATIGTEAVVRITANTIVAASAGQFLTQDSSLANAEIISVANTIGTLTIGGEIISGSINVVYPTYVITFSGNIVANVGEFITQSLSGANARVIAANVSANVNTANVIMLSSAFSNNAGGYISVNGANVGLYPTANVKDVNQRTITANVGDYITQYGYTGNATVTANVIDGVSIPVTYNSGTFNLLGGNVQINGTDANVWIVSTSSTANSYSVTVTTGQYITQASTGANAVVTANVTNGNVIPVQFIGNTFTVGRTGGNLAINNANIRAFPSRVVANTDITVDYLSSPNTFDFNQLYNSSTLPAINGTNILYANITSLVAVGATYGSVSTEGTVGFDEAKFDQGTLSLPTGLSLDTDSGWITGYLPSQTVNQIDYQFEILAYKKDDPTYQDNQLYTLTVLGDLNNTIDWITASDLGTITTGKISDLFVYAVSALGKTIFYELASDSYHRLPQGLELTLGGLLSGRVSFELFGLDSNLTTIDGGNTSFDGTFRFTVTARDIANTISANRTFTLRVRQFDLIPYENLYIKALPTKAVRDSFSALINDTSIFPLDKIYRLEDPWFGLAKEIRSLFLAGLSPSTLAEYVQAATTNHFNKRFLFNGIKTAQVLDENFNVKYEVVYLQLDSTNDIEALNFDHTSEVGPPDTIDLSNTITNPYYDAEGNSYTVAYPNSTQNMESVLVSQLGYENKGALPEWMTSRQPNGRQLGFVHSVVLAYTKPGESALIAWRLKEQGFNFNSIDFEVDRYHLDNIYSTNFDITANTYATSSETTFDRYPPLASTLAYVATVDYALTTPYDQIHLHTVADINANGGLDGIRNFKHGDTIVFGLQEFRINQNTAPDYNDGWSDVLEQWDRDPWAQNPDTGDSDTQTPYDPTLIPPNVGPYDFTPGEKWDSAQYVSGFNEHLLNPSVPNKRIGVWTVNIDADDIVTLVYTQEIDYYDALYVRNGFTYGGTNIYFDPIVKTDFSVPNYSIVPQTIRTTYTTFDGNGTRFFDSRDIYNVPGQGDKYIKFTKLGVFT